jgi:hypothetical protein
MMSCQSLRSWTSTDAKSATETSSPHSQGEPERREIAQSVESGKVVGNQNGFLADA